MQELINKNQKFYGLEIGEKLSKDLLNDWVRQGENIAIPNSGCLDWRKIGESNLFLKDTEILSFILYGNKIAFKIRGYNLLIKAAGLKEFMNNYNFPEHWYLPLTNCTKEQLEEINTWRKSQPDCSYKDAKGDEYFHDCKTILLSHHPDNSYFYVNVGDTFHLLSWTKNYKEITLEQFYKHILKKDISKFHFKIDAEQAKKIIDIACDNWKSKLAELWGRDLLLKDYALVSKELYREMKSAAGIYKGINQNRVLDEIFGKESIDLSIYPNIDLLKFVTNGDKGSLIVTNDKNSFLLNPCFSWELETDSTGRIKLKIKDK
jgi:hypothetical protein